MKAGCVVAAVEGSLILLIVVALCFWPQRCRAQDGTGWPFPDTVTTHVAQHRHGWRALDVALASSSTTFIALDLLTSSDMILRMNAVAPLCQREPVLPDCQLHETNPLLGHHPSLTKLRVVSVAGAVGNLVVGSRLHGLWRTLWFAGVTAAEFAVVRHNVNVVRLRFAL